MQWPKERFRERLVSRRNRLGWTQLALAEKSGVSERAIAAYESGLGSPPSLRILEKLAAALSCSVLWLLGGDDAPADAATEDREAALDKKLSSLKTQAEEISEAARKILKVLDQEVRSKKKTQGTKVP